MEEPERENVSDVLLFSPEPRTSLRGYGPTLGLAGLPPIGEADYAWRQASYVQWLASH